MISLMICIVCHEPACRRFGEGKYAEYYCDKHNPNDKRQIRIAEKRNAESKKKLLENMNTPIEKLPEPKKKFVEIKKEKRSVDVD